MKQRINRWASDAFDDQSIASIISEDIKIRLTYQYHPYFSWRPVPDQSLQTLKINSHGLRDNEFDARPGKDVALMIGNSYSWGFGASCNAMTPSFLLQQVLEDNYGIHLTIVNLSDQWFSYRQELLSLVFGIDMYKPKYVFIVTGINDIGNGFRGRFREGQSDRDYLNFFRWGELNSIVTETNRFTRLFKILKSFFKTPRINYEHSLEFGMKQDKADIPIEIQSLRDKTLLPLCEASGIKSAMILQPAMYMKQHKSSYEQLFVSARSPARVNYFIDQFTRFSEHWADKQHHQDNALYIDTTPYFNTYSETMFFDIAHTADKGNRVWAENTAKDLVLNHFFGS